MKKWTWTQLEKLGFKYRCMSCDKPKKDMGRWVRLYGTRCKVCQKCGAKQKKGGVI